jgi:glycolate oxidase FAD binding subunit
MAASVRPTSEEEVKSAVSEAAAKITPLAPRGHGTRSGFGRPVDHAVLDLSALTGVTLYEPEELVLTARAGTPLAEIVRMVEAAGQELPFEPPLHHLLWGAEGAGTIGGMVMAAMSGPRRIRTGAVRDHVLGIRAVSGRGEIFKAGGRVVKNVTGYDLSKGVVGSFGTLVVLTEVTVKVMPKAETEATLVLASLSTETAVEALCAAMGSPADVSGAAILPIGTGVVPDGAAVVRIEGFAPSVEERSSRLAALLSRYGRPERMTGEASSRLWHAVRDLKAVAAASFDTVWRVSVKPTAGPDVARRLGEAGARPLLFDWSGGLLWLGANAGDRDGLHIEVRAAVEAAGGGHATLMRAPEDLRRRVPVFHPQSAPLAALSRRLKATFDPAGILNPGRIGEGL